jgi:hypothetical protein
MTKLGVFSSYGRLFTVGSFSKFTREAQIFGLLFGLQKLSINFNKKMGRATFWATFFCKLIWSPWSKVTAFQFIMKNSGAYIFDSICN